jgi:hypothetical protein
MNWIRNAILRWARNRQPDFVIGGPAAPYLRRHWLIPRNRFFNIYVHEFLRSDDDRALHDHPWLFNACWTVFITGPVVRTWGFHCPKRWVPWKEFVDTRDAGAIGKGCDA